MNEGKLAEQSRKLPTDNASVMRGFRQRRWHLYEMYVKLNAEMLFCGWLPRCKCKLMHWLGQMQSSVRPVDAVVQDCWP